MKVQFRIRSKANKHVPIFVIIYHGKQIEAKTGLFVHPSDWSSARQRCIPRDPNLKNTNADLNTLTLELINAVNTSRGQAINKSFLNNVVKKTFDRVEEEDLSLLTNMLADFIQKAPTRVSSKGTIGITKGTLKNL